MTARLRAAALTAGCALLLSVAVPARAQVYIGRATPHTGSVEVSGGVVWNGGFEQGSAIAQLTRNPSTGSGAYDLFSTDTKLGAAAGGQGRLAFYLTRAFAVEGGVQYSRPVLSAAISNDAEQADPVTARETVARYVFDGSVVWHLTGASFAGGKGVPFVLGGGGYVRELHDGYGVVETGNEFHAGAGLKYWLSTGRQRFGLRAEGGIMSRSGGVDFDEKRRMGPTAGLSLAYLF